MSDAKNAISIDKVVPLALQLNEEIQQAVTCWNSWKEYLEHRHLTGHSFTNDDLLTAEHALAAVKSASEKRRTALNGLFQTCYRERDRLKNDIELAQKEGVDALVDLQNSLKSVEWKIRQMGFLTMSESTISEQSTSAIAALSGIQERFHPAYHGGNVHEGHRIH